MRGQRTHEGSELRRTTSVCNVEATTARAGRAILSVLVHCRSVKRDDWAAWKDGGRMSDDSGGVVDRSLMMLGYLQGKRQK